MVFRPTAPLSSIPDSKIPRELSEPGLDSEPVGPMARNQTQSPAHAGHMFTLPVRPRARPAQDISEQNQYNAGTLVGGRASNDAPFPMGVKTYKTQCHVKRLPALIRSILGILATLTIFLASNIAYDPELLNPHVVPAKSNGKAPSRRPRQVRRPAPYKQTQSAKTNDTASEGKANIGDKDGGAHATGKTDNHGPQPACRFFACPFYKRNPIKHLKCMLRNNLTSTSFVVQHLNRSHSRQPIHCPRCGEQFESCDERDDHISNLFCHRQTFHYDGLTEDQVRRITARHRGGSNEHERWYYLWDTLFPDTPRPDSPYVGGPLEEILGIFRRALRADRTNPFGLNIFAPLALDQLTEQSLNRIMEFFERRLLDWPHMESIIHSLDDFSMLVSDPPVTANTDLNPIVPNGSDPSSSISHRQPDPSNHDEGQLEELPFWSEDLVHLGNLLLFSQGSDLPASDAANFTNSSSSMFDHGLTNTEHTNPTSAIFDEEQPFISGATDAANIESHDNGEGGSDTKNDLQ